MSFCSCVGVCNRVFVSMKLKIPGCVLVLESQRYGWNLSCSVNAYDVDGLSSGCDMFFVVGS